MRLYQYCATFFIIIFEKSFYPVHLCMISYQKDINEAVLQLYDYAKETGKKKNGIFPNELIVAKRTVEGLISRNGVQTNIGLHRLLRLIDEYGDNNFDIQIKITKK